MGGQVEALARRGKGDRTESKFSLFVGSDDANAAKFVQKSALPHQRRRLRRARHLHKANGLSFVPKLANKPPKRRHAATFCLARHFRDAI